MKKRFVFLIFIVIALLLALFIKKCATGGLVPAKPQKSASISPASILPGKNIKKLLGETTAPGEKDYDMLVARLDASGNTKWVKAFGGADYDWADFAIQCDDGEFLALGRTYHSGSGQDDYYVIKIDASGNSLWSKIFASRNEADADSIAQVVDGGYIIAGRTFSGDREEKEVFLAKTDLKGNYQWVHNFGREYYEWGYSSIIAADGSYITVGQDETPGVNTDFYLRKRNNDGKYAWSRSYGGGDYDWGYGIAAAAGGYVLAGLTYSFGNGNDDVYLVKVNEDGDEIWAKSYGGTGYDEAFSICADRDKGFVAAGSTTSWGNGGHDVYVMSVDAKGNSLWPAVFGGAGNEAAYCINRNKDGGYIIAGATNSVWK
jgi:hypothetical protein